MLMCVPCASLGLLFSKEELLLQPCLLSVYMSWDDKILGILNSNICFKLLIQTQKID